MALYRDEQCPDDGHNLMLFLPVEIDMRSHLKADVPVS